MRRGLAAASFALLAMASATSAHPMHPNPLLAVDTEIEPRTTVYFADGALGPLDKAADDFGRGLSETWLTRMGEPPLLYRKSGFVLRLTKMYGAAAETIRIEQRADGGGRALYRFFLGKRSDRRAHFAMRRQVNLSTAQMARLRALVSTQRLTAAPPRVAMTPGVVQMDGWCLLAETNTDGDFHAAFRMMADPRDAVADTIVSVEEIAGLSFRAPE